ncbi:MAG: SUMF1/EgtB/PvdO family nonheme iron enzyme [Desulfobacterales bacterium]|nr:SUMF1/EgtB/PvdO family nonheme iron enzyme [Desulfobacterales bacterium]MBF0396159.1 SUMF1/EgtB/PvdO family nonheme iron enzyme [Desulfobacterales bacterium]
MIILIIFIFLIPGAIFANEDLQIICEPGIGIKLNDEFMGKTTPEENGMIIEELPSGTYVIEAEKEGEPPEKKVVNIKDGEPPSLKLDFSQESPAGEFASEQAKNSQIKPGTLVLRSVPQSAEIMLDGKPIGITSKTISNFPQGKHILHFILKDKTLEYTFIFSPKQILQLKADFRKNKVIPEDESGKMIPELQRTIKNSIGMEFVLIIPKTFTMGSDIKEKCRDDDENPHDVTLTQPFYMQISEVTQGQWKELLGSNLSMFSKCGDNCPVENVSWNDAQNFIASLNQRENTNKYRLPTETEWEYCCKGGETNEKQLDEFAWFRNNSNQKTHEVKQKRKNSFELYDINGNVAEWCEDWYAAYPASASINPQGTIKGQGQSQQDKVFRGGCFNDIGANLRCSNRSYFVPATKTYYIGFRIVKML